MIRYRETGEPQTFPAFDRNLRTRLWVYVQSGQLDRTMGLFGDLIRQGAYGLAALRHMEYGSDLGGGDPRYQALLEEAGITW